MKADKLWLSGLIVVIATCLISTTAYSQDMSIWIDKWFKITEKISGYYYDGSAIVKNSGTSLVYFKITGWDEASGVLSIQFYEVGEPPFEFPLYYVDGSNLDFLVRFDVSLHGLVARVQGKLKNGSVATATFKTLGGHYVGEFEEAGVPEAGSYSWNGSLIAEEKVPPL